MNSYRVSVFSPLEHREMYGCLCYFSEMMAIQLNGCRLLEITGGTDFGKSFKISFLFRCR